VNNKIFFLTRGIQRGKNLLLARIPTSAPMSFMRKHMSHLTLLPMLTTCSLTHGRQRLAI